MDRRRILRNGTVYLIGVALAVIGALGLVEAIQIPLVLAALVFMVGLACVLFVHEQMGGPV